MSIGNHAFWIILEVKNGIPAQVALCPENDQRRAIQFRDASSAWLYIDTLPKDKDFLVVKIPA